MRYTALLVTIIISFAGCEQSQEPAVDAVATTPPDAAVPTLSLRVLSRTESAQELVFNVELKNLAEDAPLDARWCNFYLDATGAGAFASCSNPSFTSGSCYGLVVRGGSITCPVPFRTSDAAGLNASAKLMFMDAGRTAIVPVP